MAKLLYTYELTSRLQSLNILILRLEIQQFSHIWHLMFVSNMHQKCTWFLVPWNTLMNPKHLRGSIWSFICTICAYEATPIFSSICQMNIFEVILFIECLKIGWIHIFMSFTYTFTYITWVPLDVKTCMLIHKKKIEIVMRFCKSL